ncbi:nucleoside deaminase [Microbacterium thalassium]|uniref:tRNA(Arg) A34 adenosine deaminase TadA n=1 Tax=Microbacterium thalassium TaxID=362649 RepID=A0A7X0FP47_9MICO|nr:nucleoside deaminase [Microbacterium thalassium]MBB6391103.1 tRNA(Arg) A34 adenosine deaminase TadA [Microbacterium thalassium]GLK23787.1 tRNA-specific adenosine deaminase [Microbacterium thalassium]
MTDITTAFTMALPDWLASEIPSLPRTLASDAERMALVNALADRNWREGNGGPFAAIVVDEATGELISVGVNVVLSTRISSGHAEVMALALAQRRLGRWDLGEDGARLALVVNWRPCVQCYGAAMWSGVRSLVVAGDGPELEELTGFDEGPMVEDWADQFRARGIDVTIGVARDDALEVYRAYGASESVVYNARGDD